MPAIRLFLVSSFLYKYGVTKLIKTVFLRILEYYQGVLFLTTNRVSTFDEAFESRIHLRLHYPDLSVKAREMIWTNMVQKSQLVAHFSVNDFAELAQHDVNGRQIKNIVKMAQLLAASKDESLAMSHINHVLLLTQKWENDTAVVTEGRKRKLEEDTEESNQKRTKA